MPSIIAHDLFGRDVLSDTPDLIGTSQAECDAFLLGCQGPDPLLYTATHPGKARNARLGSIMHQQKPTQLIYALNQSLAMLNEDEEPVGRAYALGFLCHYLLDRNEHPLVYSLEYQLCDAGVKGLTRKNKNEVHALIEREFDELALTVKHGQTIAEFAPADHILHADESTLQVVQKIYIYLVLVVYNRTIDGNLLPMAVHDFRRMQRLFYSRTGIKRAVLARIEECIHPYSMLRSMAPRPVALEESWFENKEHETWRNPFTDEVETKSFWDAYEDARAQAAEACALFCKPGFTLSTARDITHDLNFSGSPVEATLIVHDEVD